MIEDMNLLEILTGKVQTAVVYFHVNLLYLSLIFSMMLSDLMHPIFTNYIPNFHIVWVFVLLRGMAGFATLERACGVSLQ